MDPGFQSATYRIGHGNFYPVEEKLPPKMLILITLTDSLKLNFGLVLALR